METHTIEDVLGRTLYVCKAPSFRSALQRAVREGTDLSNADLRRTNLSALDLSGAKLSCATLVSASLQRADLSDADLFGAILLDADLTGTTLTRTKLERSILYQARLSGANLADANLAPIREDLFQVLSTSPNEVPGLLAHIEEGGINGSCYEADADDCACLVGSLARERGVQYYAIPGLEPDADRPAERWFGGIQPGDTPERSQIAALAARWVREWLAAR